MQLTFICQGTTAAQSTRTFPADEPLLAGAADKAESLRPGLRADARVWISPAAAARATAAALGLFGETAPALADCDYGKWAGVNLAALESTDPEGLALWLTDPAAKPHGGESLVELAARVSRWMDERLPERGHAIAVTPGAVIRAVLVGALAAPIASFWRIDVEPLAMVEFTSDGRRWSLRARKR
jgi:broad specificity phosphatase PhoE